MTVTTDNHSMRVLFNDGEGVDPDDFNAMQEYARAFLFEHLLGASVSDAVDDPGTPGVSKDLESGDLWNALSFSGFADPADGLVFAPFVGCGFMRPGAGARQLTACGGPLFTLIDEPWNGYAEAFAPFRLPAGLTLTTAIGDAANPRIDLVEMAIAYIDDDTTTRDFEDATSRAKTTTTPKKTRRPQLTIQIKQGTPAATPTYPARTAGFAVLASVRVPALHNAVHSATNLRDHRMPMGHVTPYDVPASQMWHPGANPWVLTQGAAVLQGQLVGPAAATGIAYAVCPTPAKGGRIVGIGIYSKIASGGTGAQLVAIDHNGSATPGITTLADLTNASILLTDGTAGYRQCTMAELMTELGIAPGTAENRGARTANSRVGCPMWASGYPAGVGQRIAALPEATHRQLAVALTGASGDTISFVRFFVAHGL